MVRKAFVIGSNGSPHISDTPLQYALDDVAALARCLRSPKCAFDMVISSTVNWTASQVREKLFAIAEGCQESDEILCYFSGHGWMDKGLLYLLWHHSKYGELLSKSIPISHFIHALNNCKARNKLLVLDCCRASVAVNMGELRDYSVTYNIENSDLQPSNYYILLASRTIGAQSAAKEHSKWHGSFLATHIVKALTDCFDQADKNGDNKISVQDLAMWLRERAEQHNAHELVQSNRVPVPRIYGVGTIESFYLSWNENLWNSHEYEYSLFGQIPVALLPLKPVNGKVICMGKHPTTNAQYRNFVLDTKRNIPAGEKLEKRDTVLGTKSKWVVPFIPWEEDGFREPNKPIVCVAIDDIQDYCLWLSRQSGVDVRIPSEEEWDYAALKTTLPAWETKPWLKYEKSIHHNTTNTVDADYSGSRENDFGISDMFGNVWEWCTRSISDTVARKNVHSKWILKGGSFLENLDSGEPNLSLDQLRNGSRTKRFNVGFRIVVELPISYLPESLRIHLEMCRALI